MPLGPNGIDSSVMTAFRLKRVRHSIATNGHYFAGPVTFFALNPATYLFTYRFFANHTAENSEGYLDAQTLMTFEGVTREDGKYKWSPGQERIPENVGHYRDSAPLTHANSGYSGTVVPLGMNTPLPPSLPKPLVQNWQTLN